MSRQKPDLDMLKKLMKEDAFIVSKHARTRMFQRKVSTDDLVSIIENGELIEDYAEDEPCPSLLLLGFLNDVPYHVVVGRCEDHLRIITVYEPDESKWIDYKKRRC